MSLMSPKWCPRKLVGASLTGIGLGALLPVLAAGPAAAGSVRVVRGATLSQLAAQYHTTVAALAAANGIANSNLIYSGQLLQVPSTASLLSVTVEPGDTLISLARRYGTTVSALAAANTITDPSAIYAGAHLEVPASATTLASYSTASSSSPPSSAQSLPSQLLAHPSRLSLLPVFVQEAGSHGVPAALLEALCWWESGWQTTIVSSTGAVGVCQIEPSTTSFVDTVLYPGSGLDPHAASGNIAIGAAFLHYLLQRAGDNESLAIAGYYQGFKSVEQHGMLPATRTYVKGILAYTSIFAPSG
jgi:LysM repeat protein